MINLKATRRPIQQARIGLGQFSSFVNPFEVTGDATPTTPPTPTETPAVAPAQGPAKTLLVLTGLALTGLSAATAYVGINYGTERKNTDLQRALGWTVGVIGVMSGLVRLAGTTVLALTPSESRSPLV